MPISPLASPTSPTHLGIDTHYQDSTPTKESIADELSQLREAVLIGSLNRPDLFRLSRLLDVQFEHGNWAFTGSTALMLHQAVLDPSKGFSREPSDADVLVREGPLNKLRPDTLNAICRNEGLSFESDKLHVLKLDRGTEQPPLKIDLIQSGKTGFGSIENDAPQQIHGVPVLPLETLENSLRMRIRNGESGEHSEQDIRLIRQLSASNAGASSGAQAFEHSGGDAARLQRSLSAFRSSEKNALGSAQKRGHESDQDHEAGPSTRKKIAF